MKVRDSMRLIDADRLMNVDFSECKDDSEIKAVMYAFPKAYDVDKVIKELENKSIAVDGYSLISLDRAIEIVKQGGVEHERNTV